MSLADFLKYLVNKGCIINPIEGKNLSGIGVKITYNYRSYYLNLYKDGIISDTQIVKCCNYLFIGYPPHIST